MRGLLILLLCLVGSIVIKAQGLPGKVTDKNMPLPGAVIGNIKSKIWTTTDLDGNFQLPASAGDTIVTVSMGYKTDTTVLSNQLTLMINLHPLVKTLKEVTIKDKALTPLEQYNKNREDYKQIYRIGDDSHLFFFSGGLGVAGIGVNIDALYSALSKEGRDARRLQRVMVNDYHADIVNTRFTDSLVTKITGYKGKQLDDFMINNRPSYEFMMKANDYDLITYIQRRAKGIVLPSDDPVAESKSKGKGLKIKFKSSSPQPTNATQGTDVMPKLPPY